LIESDAVCLQVFLRSCKSLFSVIHNAFHVICFTTLEELTLIGVPDGI
jgi:hypothetical protein